MLVVNVKEGEAIERALKRFKRKYDSTRVMRKLRAGQHYIKPTIAKRVEKKKAINVQKYIESQEVN